MTSIGIVGAGMNGLTCAAYLAKAGMDVTVYEKRTVTGGMCVNEKPFDNDITVSSVASYYGMMRPEVFADLRLAEHGVAPYLTDPVEIVLLDGGRYVSYPREGSTDMKIGDLSESDSKGWIAFWTDIQKAAALLGPRYLEPIDETGYERLLRENGLTRIADTIFSGSLLDLAALYFENPAFRAVAATCTPGFANKPGSVLGCIHHGTASTLGISGAWGQVKGGMGKITEAVGAAAIEYGAKIQTGRAVRRLQVDEEVTAIEFEDGTSARHAIYIWAGSLHNLFAGAIESDRVPSGILAHLEANRPTVSAAKLHFLLAGRPDFKTLASIAHNHKGVLVIAPDADVVALDSETIPLGHMPRELMLTMAYPTLEDESIYGTEKSRDMHVLTVDVHYLPARILQNGKLRPWQDSDDDELANRVLATIERYAPGFTAAVRARYIVSPNKLKSAFNNDSLSCWHMPMVRDFSFENRALPTYPHYQTPFANLYVCGAGTYPGGNVTGANGHNLAKLLQKALLVTK